MYSEIKHRLTRPTPVFWKKLQKRCAATSAAFTTLTVGLASLADHMPSQLAFLTTAAGVAAAFFGGIAAVTTLAVDDPSTLPTDSPAPDESPVV